MKIINLNKGYQNTIFASLNLHQINQSNGVACFKIINSSGYRIGITEDNFNDREKLNQEQYLDRMKPIYIAGSSYQSYGCDSFNTIWNNGKPIANEYRSLTPDEATEYLIVHFDINSKKLIFYLDLNDPTKAVSHYFEEIPKGTYNFIASLQQYQALQVLDFRTLIEKSSIIKHLSEHKNIIFLDPTKMSHQKLPEEYWMLIQKTNFTEELNIYHKYKFNNEELSTFHFILMGRYSYQMAKYVRDILMKNKKIFMDRWMLNKCLEISVLLDHEKILQFFRIDLQTKFIETFKPFHVTCFLGRHRVLRYLLRRGNHKDFMEPNKLNQTTLWLILANGHRKCLDMVFNFIKAEQIGQIMNIKDLTNRQSSLTIAKHNGFNKIHQQYRNKLGDLGLIEQERENNFGRPRNLFSPQNNLSIFHQMALLKKHFEDKE